MALARVTVWIPGDVLTAAALNGEINNLINNPITLISPTTGVITFTTAQTFPITQVVTSAGPVVNVAGPSRVTGLIGTLSSQTGTFSADGYQMRSTNGRASWHVSATSQYSASVGTAGPAAGGRDVAAVFASTYIHWYAISTGQFSTAPAGLISTTPPPTGPILPTGYTGWSYLGCSNYTSASTTVTTAHRFSGSRGMYENGQTVLSSGTATAETSVSAILVVPNNALNYGMNISHRNIASTAAHSAGLTIRIVSGADHTIITADGSDGISALQHSRVLLPNLSQSFLYLNINTIGSTSMFASADVVDYGMPNGGE